MDAININYVKYRTNGFDGTKHKYLLLPKYDIANKAQWSKKSSCLTFFTENAKMQK